MPFLLNLINADHHCDEFKFFDLGELMNFTALGEIEAKKAPNNLLGAFLIFI